MSIDGTGIIDSDLAHDVYDEILDRYDAGVEPDDIRARISSSYVLDRLNDLDRELWLAASAKAFGRLDTSTTS